MSILRKTSRLLKNLLQTIGDNKLMFTRNELFLVLFMAVFGIAGAVLNHVRNSRPIVETTVVSSAFEVRADTVADTLKTDDHKKTLKMEGVKININRAGLSDLMKLRGIGEKLGNRIIECRELIGGFKNVNDLRKVRGLGEKKLKSIEPYIEI